jgi:hypothetical protein
MGRAQTFAEVLEHELELGGYQPDRRTSRTAQKRQPTPPHPFLFVEPRFFFNATAHAALAGAPGTPWHADSSVPAPQLWRLSQQLPAGPMRVLAVVASIGAIRH